MPYSPEATPLRKLPNFWILSAVTYALVIAVGAASVLVYKHYWPKGDAEEIELAKKSASITVGDVWMPVYPGAIHQDATSTKNGDITQGDLRFTSTDPPQKLIAFYRTRLQQARYNVLLTADTNGGRIQAFGNKGKSIATLTITASGTGSEALIHTRAVETKP